MSRCTHRFFWILVAFPLLQCETPIDFPEGVRDPELGVISEFTQDRNLEVRVFEGNFLVGDRETRYIDHATVTIFQGDSVIDRLVFDGSKAPPSYVSDSFKPEPNVEYRIRVEAEGYRPVMATSRVPAQIPIDAIEISSLTIESPDSEDLRKVSYDVAVSFRDPAQEVNYYHISFLQEVWGNMKDEGGDYFPDGPELRKAAFVPNGLGDQFIAFGQGGLLFSDDFFDGQTFDNRFSLRFDLLDKEQLGKLNVELRAVSEEYYLFQTSLALQGNNPGQPIDDGVSIYNNIENGRGIFAGYNFSQASAEVH